MLDRSHLIAMLNLRKEAAVLKGLGAAGKAGVKGFFGIGKKMSDEMLAAGVKSPLAHAAAKAAPYAAALYGGKKAYDSPTGQRARYRVAVWKQQRAAKRAQRRGY
jgi:hypothetical protein